MVNEDDYALRLKNVNYFYGSGKSAVKVLDNACLSVPYGSIYALLGPSGCGKTTLLKVAMGQIRSKVDGDIKVFGQRPNSSQSLIPGPNIGYMPQELALHNFITIEETLWLFGRLSLMKDSVLKEQVPELIRMLDLPKARKCVDDLSGGQMRRVSLAMALLHNPPLLLLDEPTVGLDPLLRRTMWTHLVHLTHTYNTTVIITTHYIEEAKDANIISAMSKGRVLYEAAPSDLMKTFQGKTLEESFLNLFSLHATTKDKERFGQSAIDESTTTYPKLADYNVSSFQARKPEKISRPQEPYLFYRAIILLRRNILLSLKGKEVLFVHLTMPAITVFLFLLVMGNPMTDIRVNVVNEETNQNGSGHAYIQSMNRRLMTITESNFSAAYDAVKNGHARAFLHIKSNFTDCLKMKLEEGVDAEENILNCSVISAYQDTTNLIIHQSLLDSFFRTYQSFIEDVHVSLNLSRALAKSPLDMQSLFGSSDTPAYIFMLPGIILTNSIFLTASCTIFKLVIERVSGVTDRLFIHGVTNFDLVLSLYVVEFLKVIIITGIMFAVAFWVYALTVEGSMLTLTLLALAQGIEGIAFGLFISSALDNVVATVLLCTAFNLINLCCGGVLWPLEAIPTALRYIAYYFVPVSIPIESFKAIMNKGLGFESSVVCLGFVSSFAWVLLYLGLTLLVMKLRR